MSYNRSQLSETRIAWTVLALLILLLLVLLAYFFFGRPGEQCSDPPILAANKPDVVVDEGKDAENTGTFDLGPNCGPVKIEPNVGSVNKTGTKSGTWEWTLPDVASKDTGEVTITATDQSNEELSSSVTFSLTVKPTCDPTSLAPSLTADKPDVVVDEGEVAENTGTFDDTRDCDPDTVKITVEGDDGFVDHPVTSSGTWKWSLQTEKVDSDQSRPVTITATDDSNANLSSSAAFSLTIKNVQAPDCSVPVKSDSGDLEDYIDNFEQEIPQRNSGAYDEPTQAEREDMAAAFDDVEANNLCQAARDLQPLEYDVVRYTDTSNDGRELIMLRERSTKDDSGKTIWPHAWGTYIFSPDAAHDVTVEVTHPKADTNTENVGVRVFKEADAEDLFVAGAHRYANCSLSQEPCDDEDKVWASDVAHEEDSVFHAIHEAAVEGATRVFQPHGFDGTKPEHSDCEEVVVSSGEEGPSEPGGLAEMVHDEIERAGFRATLFGDPEEAPNCDLGGTGNEQGQHTQGIEAAFLHVEIDRPIRDDVDRLSRLSCAIAGALIGEVSQICLLPPDSIGAQAQADIGFANLAPPPQGDTTARHVDVDGPDNIPGNADDGNDDNPGTKDQPWKTLDKALNTLSADGADGTGRVAYVHEGTYQEKNLKTARDGNATAPIWLIVPEGEEAVVKRDDAELTAGDASLIVDDPYWIIDGLAFDGAGAAFDPSKPHQPAMDVTQTHHVVLKNVEVRNGTGSEGIRFFAAKDAALLDSNVHDQKEWFKAGNPISQDSHGVAVTNGSERVLIKDNQSSNNDGDAVQCLESDGAAGVRSNNVWIEGNRYHADRENAVDIKWCDNLTIRNNDLFGYRPYVPSDENNTNRSPGGDAIVVHFTGDRVLIENNRIWDSGRAASFGSTSPGGDAGAIVFRRNLVRDMTTAAGSQGQPVNGPGSGLQASLLENVEVYHNTFHNIPKHAVSLGGDGEVKRAVVINNIFHNSTGSGESRAMHVATTNIFALMSDHNLFWNAPLPDGWQHDQTSKKGKDPLFIDPRNNDFHTKPESPARDTALRIPVYVDPSNRDVCGAGPDIGFLESCP